MVDVTFARLPRGASIRDWRVRADLYSDSDHRYVQFSLRLGESASFFSPPHAGPGRGWSRKKLDEEKLVAVLRSDATQLRDYNDGLGAEDTVAILQEYLESVSDSAMPRRDRGGLKRAVHWWTEEIAAMRRESNSALRAYQRAGRRNAPRNHLQLEFRQARKKLRTTIRKAQEAAWCRLVEGVEADPWGLGYRIVSRRIRGRPAGAEAAGHE